ncbi:MAG: hypothetical protein ABIR94_15330 [Rubrivivax sp.]
MRRLAQWLLRYLLIAVLAFDLVGSPLHAHHHDSGTFDLGGEALAGHVGEAAGEVHAESRDGHAFMHSLVALRAGKATMAAPAATDEADTTLASVAALILRARTAAAVDLTWRPTRERVALSVFRSLPPDGRAPPVLHG